MGKFGNGSVIGDGQIAIDYWYRDKSAKLYFLTHLHADHIDGLTQTWYHPIYTSELNCKLAPKFVPGINPKLLKPLPLNEETRLKLTR